MMFNQAQKGNWFDTYTCIKQKYAKYSYKMPQIVFWNLRAAKPAFPTTKDTPGVALVSGFSAELLKVFMEGGDFTPISIMKRTVQPYLEKVQIHPEEV